MFILVISCTHTNENNTWLLRTEHGTKESKFSIRTETADENQQHIQWLKIIQRTPFYPGV